MKIRHTFKRYEKKFLLTRGQFEAVLPMLRERMAEEEYGRHTICNLYFDTDSYELIRTSLAKPPYKEKFRLRSYGVPGEADMVFAEIKRKIDGVVYKRRVEAAPSVLRDFLENGRLFQADEQIQREILWFLHHYKAVPKVFIAYERVAFFGRGDPDFRVTFDENIRWRDYDLDLRLGDAGSPVLPEDRIVMEVKSASAVPLWLVSLLSERRIYPTSFSKYGICYQRHLIAKIFRKAGA